MMTDFDEDVDVETRASQISKVNIFGVFSTQNTKRVTSMHEGVDNEIF